MYDQLKSIPIVVEKPDNDMLNEFRKITIQCGIPKKLLEDDNKTPTHKIMRLSP